MDFQRILNIVKKTGDKFIIVEADQPGYVVLSFDEYERMVSLGASRMEHDAMMSQQRPEPMRSTQPAVAKTMKVPSYNTTPSPKSVQKDLDEKELLERVNRDIAEYRTKQEHETEESTPEKKEGHYYISSES